MSKSKPKRKAKMKVKILRWNQKRKLSMTFCVEDVNNAIDAYFEANPGAERFPPEEAYKCYDGALIVCLKKLLIDTTQEWTFASESYYCNIETGEIDSIPVQITMPLMPFTELKEGSKSIKVDRGNGLKTRWQGINTELNAVLESQEREGFTYVKTLAFVSCVTAFPCFADYSEFLLSEKYRQVTV